ncbi:helix-turn-helix domain-containing protein [Streptomyces sp. SAS_260]|uniref:helix-turn-helix domain-containing protein n=1 Tax=Streptomyces sp. SAS_260 TaxID=3412751 RepID=UPI00403C116F
MVDEYRVVPFLQRHRLRERLRRLREASGLTQTEVADWMDWSVSKVIRIESGATGVSVTDVRALLHRYGVTDASVVEELLSIARAARGRSWVDRYKGVVPQARLSAIAYESSASLIRGFDPQLVPVLLQTEEYAWEALRAALPPEEAETRVHMELQLLTERQERAFQDDGPEMHFIVDEAVLARAVGGPGVMQRQLAQLTELAGHPNVSLRVVPFRLGLYQHLTTRYTIYELPNPEDGPALFCEAPAEDPLGCHGLPADESITSHLESFFGIESQIPTADTPTLIDTHTKQTTG